jgi:hypothetical protein
MKSQQYKETVEALAKSRGEQLLFVLDELKNEIADVRIGEHSQEARLCAIEIIDDSLYNIVKKTYAQRDSRPLV